MILGDFVESINDGTLSILDDIAEPVEKRLVYCQVAFPYVRRTAASVRVTTSSGRHGMVPH